jgi:hypothetical protein
LKKPFTKRAGGVAQGVGSEFKPQNRKKKKKKGITDKMNRTNDGELRYENDGICYI